MLYVHTHTHTHTHSQDQPGRSGRHSSRVFAGTWSCCGGAGAALQPVALPSGFLKQVFSCTGVLDLQPSPSLILTQKIPAEVETGGLQARYGHSPVCLHSLCFIRHLLQSFKPGRCYLHHRKTASTNYSHQIIFSRVSFTKIASAKFGIRRKNAPSINE